MRWGGLGAGTRPAGGRRSPPGLRTGPARVPSLAGRVALVTGGSRGVGRAVILRLAAEGTDVALTYRREAARAAEVVGAVEALGRRALALLLDLRRPEDVAPAVAQVAERYGRIDIVVANAAATAFRPLTETRDRHVTQTFAISVKALLELVRAALPSMRGRPGRIVAISGIDSLQAMAGHGTLGAAKAAVEALVRSLALELGPEGITVNAVSPGFLRTEGSRFYVERGLGLDYAATVARLVAATPRRRLGTPEDVAALVAWLCGDEADFLTGQTLVLDGGLTIRSPLDLVGELRDPPSGHTPG